MLPAERSGLLARGMVLLRVGRTIVAGSFFNEVMHAIRNSTRPILLQFAAPGSPALQRADAKYGERKPNRASTMLRKAAHLSIQQRHGNPE